MKHPITYILFFTFVLQVGCKKFVDIEPAPGLIETESIFTDEKTAVSAVNGVYVLMNSGSNSYTCSGLAVYTGLASDEIQNNFPNVSYESFLKNSLLPDNSIVTISYWSVAYKIIYRANAILEGLNKSTVLKKETKDQLAGEMKVVRALSYLYLSELFGDVPLILKTDYTENQAMPRIDKQVVYQQIITDLEEAYLQLTPDYPGNQKTRPNKWTAASLLTRVYLYRQDWEKAETFASAVIDAGTYSLTTLSNVFKINSPETIWELAAVNNANFTTPAVFFAPSSPTAKPNFNITPSLLSAFETGDERKTIWLNYVTNNGLDYYYPFKFKQRSIVPITEYNILFRLAELRLIRAEARCRLQNLAGALEDVNLIRSRASLPPLNITEADLILTAIDHERQVELFTESGHRWLDLKRKQKADAVLSPLKAPNWQTTDTLFPIPFNELQYNPALVQNPGY